MADINEFLRQGIRFGAVRLVRQKQIDEAANGLIQAGTVTREILEQLGRDVAGDALLFNGVDVDQLQKVLKRMKKVGVSGETDEDAAKSGA